MQRISHLKYGCVSINLAGAPKGILSTDIMMILTKSWWKIASGNLEWWWIEEDQADSAESGASADA
jgi:hypothetical protein